MNDPVIQTGGRNAIGTRIPLESARASAGLTVAAREMILVFGLCALLLLGICILQTVRGLREDVAHRAALQERALQEINWRVNAPGGRP